MQPFIYSHSQWLCRKPHSTLVCKQIEMYSYIMSIMKIYIKLTFFSHTLNYTFNNVYTLMVSILVAVWMIYCDYLLIIGCSQYYN